MDLELYKELVSSLSPEITLRHDVDVSLDAAAEIAKIDNYLRRQSYFYFRTDNEYYGINRHKINRFSILGHFVGAHINSEFILNAPDLCAYLEMARDNFPFLNCYTIHINTKWTAQLKSPTYIGFRNDNLCPNGYISDSRGVLPIIPKDFKGVLNLHPEWWVYPGNSPKEKLEYYFNQQKEKCLKEILPDLHS